MKMNYVVLAGLWIIWCAIHSGMIWVTVTDSLKRRLGSYFRFYCLFFNLTAMVAIIPVIFYGRSLRAPAIFHWEGFMSVFQIFLFAMGILLFLAGARHYDMLQFLGIRQIKTDVSNICYGESVACFWIVHDESQRMLKLSRAGALLGEWSTPVAQDEGLRLTINRLYLVSDVEAKLYIFSKPQ